MLRYMLVVAALFFCAGVGMWLCLLAVRAMKVALANRRRHHRHFILAAMTRFRMSPDRLRLVDELRRADPRALIDIASRLLPLFTEAEREAFETALARRRLAEFMSARIGSANEAKRLLYCELLGVLGSERSLRTLWQALGDRSPAVRIAAAISLAVRGEVAEIGDVLGRIGRDARRSARLTYFFDALVPERAAEVRAIATDTAFEPRVRISAFVALAAVSEANYRQLVPVMAADAAPQVAAAAARLLLEGPHPEAARLLARLLASRFPQVRREASDAAARLGDQQVAPALRRALRDRDPLVHATAARSLVRLAQERAPAFGASAG